jgi:hypothetical protein
MKDTKGTSKPVDMEMEGATVEAHGVMVTPVARVRGQAGGNSGGRGSWRYAWAAIRPVRMNVRDATGQTSEVQLAPTEGQVLAAMAATGLLVAVVTVVISLLAGRRQR